MALPSIRQPVHPASALLGPRRQAGGTGWRFAELAGQLVELSAHGASATLTLAMRLVWEAQHAGEPVAWIATRARCFYPPDAADNGIDLESLAVVRVPDAQDICKAADYLLRSGAFGLVVLDLGNEVRPGDDRRERAGLDRQLTRLLGLARRYETAVLCLTRKSDQLASLGSVVALRGSVARERGVGGFMCRLHALKDKRRPPGWQHTEVCHGPAGLY